MPVSFKISITKKLLKINDHINRIYNSCLSETARRIYYRKKHEKRSGLFEKLTKHLNSKDMQLLNEYANAALDVTNEEK